MTKQNLSLYFLLALFTILVNACTNLETVELKNEQGVVIERYTQVKGDSTLEGTYETFDDQGVLLETANYTAGKLDGTRKLYFPEGGIQYEEQHVAGQFQGRYKSYYPDGAVALEGDYIDDKMSGVWTAYYPSGEMKEKVTFSDNQENGPFEEWYINGNKKAEGNYKNGDNEHGELLLYNEEGQLIRKMECENGICTTVWPPKKKSE